MTFLQLIKQIFKVVRNGRLRIIVMTIISTKLMRCGYIALSNWFVKHADASHAMEVGVYRYQSVASWVNVHGKMQEIYPERSMVLHPVNRIGYRHQVNDMHAQSHALALPAISLNTLWQVEVIGGSEMLFTPENTVVYDEIALGGDINRYGTKVFNIVPHGYFPPYLPAATNEFLQCHFHQPESPVEVPCAISLLKDHNENYYHWLLESLPRAVIALRQSSLLDYPILIDEGLPAQFLESLHLLSPSRKYIPIQSGLRVHVQKLIFPSVFAPTHDYYGNSPQAKDFLIAPEAIALLREAYLPLGHLNEGNDYPPFIYVARTGGSHRSISNEAVVIEVVKEFGFAVIYPGKLSFSEQISLFHNAKVIVGPTGAGMANIIFSKPDCNIAILAGATNNANYYLFAQLAQHSGQLITYVGGKPSNSNEIHSDYKIDVNVLRKLLAEYTANIQ